MKKPINIKGENGSVTIELSRNYRIHYERIYNNPERLTVYNEITKSRMTIVLNPFKVTELRYRNPQDKHVFFSIVATLASLKTL